MAQKVLAGRAADSALSGDRVEVEVDQIVLARAPMRAFSEGLAQGLKKAAVELAMAYDGRCVTDASAPATGPSAMLPYGVLVGRPGVGFPAPVHVERFASPARLCVTDDPRLMPVGGIGMLTLVVGPAQLGHALAHGTVTVRPPRSVHVILTGRMRPFVCARDVSLELLRRGLGEAVRRVEREAGAPVVVEFGGPSARLLSVGERSVLAGIAPQVGAAGALFVSDERTEVFLRDQRRSKAHRGLAPDPGAPFAEVLQVDLAAVDPLLQDEAGNVRTVRDLAGKPVSQVLLGGDSGVTLRDLLAAAMLLKSKRVPARVDLLLAVPTRQMLEVLALEGALTDLVATGARIIEPDHRVMTGELYAARGPGASLRTAEAEPRVAGSPPCIVASAETLAYAVATGEIGDPRSFKRPIRVSVPRTLPTDDVLVARERGGERSRARAEGEGPRPRRGADVAETRREPQDPPAPTPWKGAQTLDVAASAPSPAAVASYDGPGLFVVAGSLDEARHAAHVALEAPHVVRALASAFLPSGVTGLLAGVGVLAVEADPGAIQSLRAAKSVLVPPPGQWTEHGVTSVQAGASKVSLRWSASAFERAWAAAGTARAPLSRQGRA